MTNHTYIYIYIYIYIERERVLPITRLKDTKGGIIKQKQKQKEN